MKDKILQNKPLMHPDDESECLKCKKLGNNHYNKFVFKSIVQFPEYGGSFNCKACGDSWHLLNKTILLAK